MSGSLKECDKFIDGLRLHYHPPDLISAEEVGIRKGWRAALEWVLRQRNGSLGGEVISVGIINKELNGKT